jgi:GDP-4-dehydro-6-deoxy-D-mannose reductase
MRILLTGVTGFAGSWLADALLAQGGHTLAGLSLAGAWPANCRHLSGRVQLHTGDLCGVPAIERVLREFQPEQIYHLAGYASTGKSFREPDAAWHGNLTATRSLYDAVLRWGGRPRILAVSSGLVYGESDGTAEVLDEQSVLRPSSPYAASKAAADLVSYQYAVSDKLDILRARPFNHFGPRQAPDFAVASFARQVAEILRGTRPPVLEIGDLSAERDLTDVRDVARAYILLMERGRRAEAYNIASGASRPMRSVLDALLQLAGVQVQLRVREDLLRPAEPRRLRISVGKLHAETGWEPRYRLEQTLSDTLHYWSQS